MVANGHFKEKVIQFNLPPAGPGPEPGAGLDTRPGPGQWGTTVLELLLGNFSAVAVTSELSVAIYGSKVTA